MNIENIVKIKKSFSDKVKKAQYLKKIITSLVENGDFNKAEMKTDN